MERGELCPLRRRPCRQRADERDQVGLQPDDVDGGQACTPSERLEVLFPRRERVPDRILAGRRTRAKRSAGCAMECNQRPLADTIWIGNSLSIQVQFCFFSVALLVARRSVGY